ncbi:MAG: hypothetical protein CMO26_02705 [Thiotrichales bacterium]|nr:hypothetical protein [Thiotrichales bacterium]
MLDTRPIEDSSFGIEVVNLDVSENLPAETIAELVRELHEHRVVILKNQRVDKQGYLSFARRLGRPDIHALTYARLPDYPEIEPIGNVNNKDRETSIRNGAAYWHTEHAYEANPVNTLLFYAQRVPQVGGETWLADMRTAYEDLDEEMKRRIDGLIVKHDFCAARRNRDGSEFKNSAINAARDAGRLPPVRHYLSPPHPATGRKSLYAVTGFTYGIEGMEDTEANALLAELEAHALNPKYLYARKHVVGDILVLDTLQTLHRGTELDFTTGPHDARLLWNIALKGAPESCVGNWRPCEPEPV